MKTHQVINNQGETVKTFEYSNGDYDSWWNAKEKAEKLRALLNKKYQQWFGIMQGCKSQRPWHKKAAIKYSL